MVDLFPRGQPKLGLQPQEPLRDDQAGCNQLPREVGRDPPQAREEVCPHRAKEEVCPHPAGAGGLPPQARVGGHWLPTKAVGQPR